MRWDDAEVNDLQRRVSNEIAVTLATQQPMARDLRELLALYHAAAELERMGDYAVNIAKLAQQLASEPEIPMFSQIPIMERLCRSQLRAAMRALVDVSESDARAVCANDDELDRLYDAVYRGAMELMQADPSPRAAGHPPDLHRPSSRAPRRPRDEHRRGRGLPRHRPDRGPELKRKILVVEDDRTLRQALTFNLAREGYEVASAVDGEQALAAGRDRRHDLILLDLMLPGMSGLEVLRTLRREGVETPVIVLSAKGEEVDRVVGPQGRSRRLRPQAVQPPRAAGPGRGGAPSRRPERAPKPMPSARCSPRARSGSTSAIARSPSVTSSLDLTTKEFDLLSHLVAHPGQIFTRHQLLARIWGYDYDGTDRTVDVHVSWLRTKLRALDGHDYFRTVRGVGYAFRPRP